MSPAECSAPHNKGMKLSKPGYLGGSWPVSLGIVEAGFAAYAQCWADHSRERAMFGRGLGKAEQPSGEQKLRCSFCDKSQDDVRKLIAGPTAYICDECVAVCVDIITDDARRSAQPAHQARPEYRPGPPTWSADARCTMCRMPIVLEEAVAVPNRALLCGACVSEVQAAAVQASDPDDASRGEP
jgi:hypothetical protein